MNRRFVAAFVAACIVAAVGAAASVAYRVFSQDAAGRLAAKADFEGLEIRARLREEPLGPRRSGTPGDGSPPRYEADPELLLVDVYERGAGDRWRIPADSPYLPSLRTEGAVPRPAYPPSSTVLLSSPLKGDSAGRMAVDALYTSLSQISAFEAFRDALIGLAAFLALAALVLAIVSGSDAARSLSLATEGPSQKSGGPAGGRRASARKAAERSAAEMAAAAAEYQYEETLAEAAEKASVSASTGISIKEAAIPADLVRADLVRADEEFDIPLMNDEPVGAGDFREAEDGFREAENGSRAAAEGPAGLYSRLRASAGNPT